jgi:hypothetical protein
MLRPAVQHCCMWPGGAGQARPGHAQLNSTAAAQQQSTQVPAPGACSPAAPHLSAIIRPPAWPPSPSKITSNAAGPAMAVTTPMSSPSASRMAPAGASRQGRRQAAEARLTSAGAARPGSQVQALQGQAHKCRPCKARITSAGPARTGSQVQVLQGQDHKPLVPTTATPGSMMASGRRSLTAGPQQQGHRSRAPAAAHAGRRAQQRPPPTPQHHLPCSMCSSTK